MKKGIMVVVKKQTSPPSGLTKQSLLQESEPYQAIEDCGSAVGGLRPLITAVSWLSSTTHPPAHPSPPRHPDQTTTLCMYVCVCVRRLVSMTHISRTRGLTH